MEALIIKSDNVQAIINTVPQAYSDNLASHDRCVAAGTQLLAQIEQGGMTEELDKQLAEFIRKSKATVKAMLERRSPSTKLMDECRSVFTQLESDIDPTNKKSIGYKLQALRNKYAAEKLEQAEAERRAAAEMVAAQAARAKYRGDVAADYMQQFSKKLDADVATLLGIATSLTLETYAEAYEAISKFPIVLPGDWFLSLCTAIVAPAGIGAADLTAIRGEVVSSIIRRCQDQYQFEMAGTRTTLLETLPSKKAELERAAAAPGDGAEVRCVLAEADQRQAEAISQLRQTRQAAATQAELEAPSMASDLFMAVQGTTPSIKANVKKELTLVNSKGILKIIALWWEEAGKEMTPAELEAMFKKQITFCNKLANQPTPVLLNDPDIAYKDVVVAK